MTMQINWTEEQFKTEISNYQYLIENFINVDTTDRDSRDASGKNFQIACNSYFRNALVARSHAGINILGKYYELLEAYKDMPNRPTFKDTLTKLYKETGIITPFLASQIVHFFNPDMPIYSRWVRTGLNAQIDTQDIENACKDYEHLTKLMHDFRDSAAGQEIIQSFRSAFNGRTNRSISDTKIIDFYFWFTSVDNGD